ncbi:aminotransferase family protein [Solimonas marina]|uniref:Aspartate aminotransferase family protein n=1 Tax=Solimonas marina TaxID=2714601 RepID=A0A970B9P4_9GAMM|nr:aspartate aminotransferase family protein [Solimonas marina]NKF23559.1 aspartate aminotransferase family protein [Solimonas marina]
MNAHEPKPRPELEQQALEHIWFHATPPAALRQSGGMLVFEKGEGCYLTDHHGDTYLDALSGGAFVTNIGHGRSEVAQAYAEQAAKLAYVTPYNFVAQPTVELAQKIGELAPGDLNRVFFGSGGTDAVEVALKIAKQYHWLGGDQKRTKVISRRGSYHGSSFYAMSVTGASHEFNSKMFAPLVPGCLQVPSTNYYRCEFDMSEEQYGKFCADMVEHTIVHEGPETVAAIIAEPIPSAASIYLPPDGYLKRLREIADKYGVLLIIDEVINGFGRTGKMFACEHWGVQGDIMTMAKGLTSGYAPMGATVVSDRVTARFDSAKGRESGLNHVISFGGHAASAAAALKNIEIMQTESMVENSAKMGALLLEGLNDLRKYPIVGDVRGKGLLAAVELVRDAKTKTFFSPADGVSPKVTSKLQSLGVLARTFQVVEFGPPLCAGPTEIQKIVEAMEQTIVWLMKEMNLG